MISLVTVLLAICSVNGAKALQCFQARVEESICPSGGVIEGVETSQSNYKNHPDSNLDDCYQTCLSDIRCLSWELSISQECILFYAKFTDVYRPESESGNLFGSWNCGPVDLRPLHTCDSSGPNYGFASVNPFLVVPALSASDCHPACSQNALCQTWGWVQGDDGYYCNFFRQDFEQIFTQDSLRNEYGSWDCPHKTRPTHNCDEHRKYSGNHEEIRYDYKNLDNAQDCFTTCTNDPICNTWSYGYGVCILYQQQFDDVYLSALGDSPRLLSAWDCQPLARAPLPCATYPTPGDVGEVLSYTAIFTSTALECQAACNMQSNCNTWGFSNGRCDLYGPDAASIVNRHPGYNLYGTWNCLPQRRQQGECTEDNIGSGSADIFVSYTSSSAADPTQCYSFCADDETCLTWQFEQYSCYLYYSEISAVRQPGDGVIGSWMCPPRNELECAESSNPTQTGPLPADVMPYDTIENSDVRSCLALCKQDLSCSTWRLDSTTTCNLFQQEFPDVNPSRGSGDSYSGSWNCPPPRPSHECSENPQRGDVNTDFSTGGPLLLTFPSACASNCNNNLFCKTWALTDYGDCWSFSQDIEQVTTMNPDGAYRVGSWDCLSVAP